MGKQERNSGQDGKRESQQQNNSLTSPLFKQQLPTSSSTTMTTTSANEDSNGLMAARNKSASVFDLHLLGEMREGRLKHRNLEQYCFNPFRALVF